MNVSLFLVVLLAALTCGGKKKKKGKGINVNSLFQSVIRTPPKPAAPVTTTAPPKTTAASTSVAPTTSDSPEYTGVVLKSFNTSDIKSSEELFKMLNISLPKQPDGGNSQGGSHGSSGSSLACSQIGCSTRPTAVRLPAEAYGFGYSLLPPCAVVNRCGGCCYVGSHSCQPTFTRMKPVNTVLIKLGMNLESMTLLAGSSFTFNRIVVPVEEHVHCNCNCTSSAATCDSKRQDWDIGRCGCVCKPEFQNLGCKAPFKYDRGTCKCVCAKAKEDCPHNMKWDVNDCQCVCRKDIKCAPYKSPDPNNNCVCA